MRAMDGENNPRDHRGTFESYVRTIQQNHRGYFNINRTMNDNAEKQNYLSKR